MRFVKLTSPCLAPNILQNDLAINILLRLSWIVLGTMALPLNQERSSLLVLLAWPVLDDPFHIIPVLIGVFSNPDCWARFRGGCGVKLIIRVRELAGK